MDENLVVLWGYRLVEYLDESWAECLVSYLAVYLDERSAVRKVSRLVECWVYC